MPYYEVDDSRSSETQIDIYTKDGKTHSVWVPKDSPSSAPKGSVVSRTTTTGKVSSGPADVEYSRDPFKIISVTFEGETVPPRKSP